MERTTCTGGVTVSPIPENVLRVECVLCTSIPIPRIHISRLTSTNGGIGKILLISHGQFQSRCVI